MTLEGSVVRWSISAASSIPRTLKSSKKIPLQKVREKLQRHSDEKSRAPNEVAMNHRMDLLSAVKGFMLHICALRSPQKEESSFAIAREKKREQPF